MTDSFRPYPEGRGLRHLAIDLAVFSMLSFRPYPEGRGLRHQKILPVPLARRCFQTVSRGKRIATQPSVVYYRPQFAFRPYPEGRGLRQCLFPTRMRRDPTFRPYPEGRGLRRYTILSLVLTACALSDRIQREEDCDLPENPR